MLLFCFPPSPTWANPNGETVMAGTANFNRDGTTLEITTSDRAIISWHDFSIGVGQLTQFIQPGTSSAVLNRVTSGISSSLLGDLLANGQVYLINPNGILIGAGAHINTASFIASTLDVSDGDFLAGSNLNFVGDSLETVENLGTIEAIGGDIFLIAHTVKNSGRLSAPDGMVGLAAGQEVLILQSGSERVFVKPTGSNEADTGILNAGIIEAAQAELKAHGNIYALAIKNEGVLRVTGATLENGRILLTAEGGNILNTGTLSAKQGDQGGEVIIHAAKIVNDGTIESNGLEGGLVQLEGEERVTLTGDSVTSSRAGKKVGVGGTVLVRALGTERSAALFLENALIDVSGGEEGGDGGFIDVSAKGAVLFEGNFDLSAQPGYKGGDILIDPRDIFVENAVGGGRTFVGNAPLGNPSPWNPLGTSDANDLQIGFGEYTTGTSLSMDPRANGSFGNGRFGNGSTITLRANRDLFVNDVFNVDTATGALNVNLVLEANRHIDISANLTTTGTATITADANATGPGDFTIDSNATLSTTNSALQIKARDIDIANGTINTGTGTTTLLSSNGGTIRLGDGAGNMIISGAELQNISAANLVIGDSTNNNISVRNITAANSNNITGTVTLNATGATRDVTFETNPSTFNALVVNAGDDIDVNIGLVTDTGILSLIANNDVTVQGNVTAAGAVTLTADSDGSGAGDFTVVDGVTINSTNNFLQVTANDIDLNTTGALNSGAAATTLLVSDGGTIGLGDTAGNYTLSGAELQNITATGLTIGDATNGNITVDNITAANSNNIAGTVTLNATADNASIAFSNNASTFNALTANADDGVTFNAAVTTDTGSLVVEGDADNAADTNDNISIAAGLTLASATSMTLDATTGGITGLGAVTLNANNGITLNNNFTSAGATIFDTDLDNSGTGDFSLATGLTVSTTNNTLQITSNDFTLTGTAALNSGAAATTLLVSDAGTIGLGDTAGNYTLSGAELQNITATGLTIGDATNGNITVDNITAANSNNIAGTVTLNATAATRSITFQNNASTFNALTANAGDDINVNSGLSADTGTLSLSANNDVTIGALGSVTTTGAANDVNIVVDNQFPISPLFGAGLFTNNGTVAAAGRFLIYTVQASQNTLGTLVPPNQQFSTYFGDVVNFAGSGILFKVAAPVAAVIAAVASASTFMPEAEVMIESLPLQIIELFKSSYNRIQELYQSSEYDYKKRVGKIPYNTFYVPREKTVGTREPIPNRVGPFSLSYFETFFQRFTQEEYNEK